MKKRIGLVLVCVSLCAYLNAAQKVVSKGMIAEQIVAPYVEIRSDSGVGSGTVIRIGDEILILTAGHVVEDAKNKGEQPVLVQKFHGGETHFKADIVLFSGPEENGGHDLALLRPLGGAADLKPAKFLPNPTLEVGQDCWYIGTPRGIHKSLEKSIINQDDFEWRGLTYYLTNGHGTFGNSGGGLFVKDGDGYSLIGVIVRATGDGSKHLIFCQTAETIANFLKDYKL